MKVSQVDENEMVAVVLYTSLFFMLLAVGLFVFFYLSRKRILEKELEKKDLEIQFKKDQIQAVILTQEEERKRIAQDLHDDISSKLNIVALNSHLLNRPNLTNSEIQEITKNIIDITGKALDSSRKIAHGLLPPVLEKFGLHAGVEELCSEFSSSQAVKIVYNSKTVFNIADNDRHLHVFRILQELMNNSLRHGKATIITILFEEFENHKKCTYTDNGIGFLVDVSKNRKGLGMKNIESRITFLNGSLNIDSLPSNGVTINFNFE